MLLKAQCLELDLHGQLNANGTTILFRGFEVTAEDGNQRLLIETKARCLDHLDPLDLTFLAKDKSPFISRMWT